MKIPIYRQETTGTEPAAMGRQQQASVFNKSKKQKLEDQIVFSKAYKDYCSLDVPFEDWLLLTPPPMFDIPDGYFCQECTEKLTLENFAVFNSSIQLCKNCDLYCLKIKENEKRSNF